MSCWISRSAIPGYQCERGSSGALIVSPNEAETADVAK